VTIGGRRPGKWKFWTVSRPANSWSLTVVLRTRPGQAVNVIAVDTGNEPLARLLNQEQKGAGQ
jgi:hypothetical protein